MSQRHAAYPRQPDENYETPAWIAGAKNVKTLWREAEKLLDDDTAPLQMVDPLT